MAKFSVGNIIENKHTGNLYTIVALDLHWYYLKSHNNGYLYREDAITIDKNFELVRKEKNSTKFKIGDVVENTCSGNLYNITYVDENIYKFESHNLGIIYTVCRENVEQYYELKKECFCSSKKEILFVNNSRWNTKCNVCGGDAYESPFSFECSNGCKRY